MVDTGKGVILTGPQKGINSLILDILKLKYLIEIQEGMWSPKWRRKVGLKL